MVVADHLGALELLLGSLLHLRVIAHPRFAVNVRESRLRRRLVRVLLASCTSYIPVAMPTIQCEHMRGCWVCSELSHDYHFNARIRGAAPLFAS